MRSSSTTVAVRLRSGESETHSFPWEQATLDRFVECQPWRRFRWRDGQKHYSGEYWSATVGDSIIYESLLELANLRIADYDRAVTYIAAQPFLLRTTIQGRAYRHVPDFLLLKNSRPTVVDVKPRGQLTKPKLSTWRSGGAITTGIRLSPD
ncbi:TnsA-like heteromeric transposase endonuclease subunit [Nocardia sp. NPDC055049]